MTSRIELGCALRSNQGIKLSRKVPFATFEQLAEELPSFQAQTRDSYKLVDRLRVQNQFGVF